MSNFLNKIIHLTDAQYTQLKNGTAVTANGTTLSTIDPNSLYITDSGGDANTVNGHTVGIDVPANAIFTDHYHITGTWDGMTYTAQSVNNAESLSFTLPSTITANLNGNANTASKLSHVAVDLTTINNTTGSYAFSITAKIPGIEYTGTPDWTGLQIGDSNDKWQLTAIGNTLYFRQNDSGGTNTSWNTWTKLLNSENTSTGTNNNETLNWSTTYTIAKINNTDIKFTTMAKPTPADIGAATNDHNHNLNYVLKTSTTISPGKATKLTFSGTFWCTLGVNTSNGAARAFYQASGYGVSDVRISIFELAHSPQVKYYIPENEEAIVFCNTSSSNTQTIWITMSSGNFPTITTDLAIPTDPAYINHHILTELNYKSYAWARPSTITTDQVLISNGTDGTTSTRAILNNTSIGALGWDSGGAENANNLRLLDVNTLAYWDGEYKSGVSNLSKLGTITSGVWNATTIGIAYGGTGATTDLEAITNLGGLYTGGKGTNDISANEDLDSYSTPGTYRSPAKETTNSLSHCPVVGTGFKLYVIRNYTETHRIHQILVENSNRFYIRYGTTADGALTWTDWERTVNTIMPSDNTTYCVANRLGWSHDNKGHIRFTDHYVDADKISVNKVDPPSENFYVEGTSKFNIGTNDTVADKKFIINGNNRYLSLGGAGIQAYTSTSTGPLYLQFGGGKVEVGKDTTTTTWMQIHGPSATTAFFSSGLVVSHTTNPAIELVRASSGKTNWQIVNEGGTLKMRHNHNGTSAQGSYVTTPISIAYNGTMTITSASSSGTIESTSTLYLSAGSTAAASLIFKGWNGTANDEISRFNSSGKLIVGKLASPNSITEQFYVEGNGKVNGTFHVTGQLLSGIGTGTGTGDYDYVERASLYNFANYGRSLFQGSGNQNTSESLGLIKICCTDSRLKNLIALTQKSTNEIYALIRYDAGDTNFVQAGQWMFFEGSPISSTSESAVGTGYFEQYKLPPVNAGLTASVAYDILTTKNHANRLIYYGTCATAATTRAKVVSDIDDFPGLIPGVCIRIKFTNQQNRSVASTYDTLNVEGTGAIEIRTRGTTGHVRYQWQAGEVLDFVYDGTYWIIQDGGIADTTYYGMTKLYTGAGSTSTALALTPSSLYTFANSSIAPIYNASNTYAVGDVVRHSYTNYRCNTAITTAEEWTDAHWTALDPLQVQMEGKLSLTGGTLTGSLIISGSKTNLLTFYKYDENTEHSAYFGVARNNPGSGNLYYDTRFRFLQYSYNSTSKARSDYYEYYDLPTVTAGLTANKLYYILTTKDTFIFNNGISSFGNLYLTVPRNGYYGILLGPTVNCGHIMGNENYMGIYCESQPRWAICYNRAVDRVSIGSSDSLDSAFLSVYGNIATSGNIIGLNTSFISKGTSLDLTDSSNGLTQAYHQGLRLYDKDSRELFRTTGYAETNGNILAYFTLNQYNGNSQLGHKGIWMRYEKSGAFDYYLRDGRVQLSGTLQYETGSSSGGSYGTTSTDPDKKIEAAIKNYWNAHHASYQKSGLIAPYLSMGNAMPAIGYFLDGASFDTVGSAYGGFFVPHYDVPRYIGIYNGTWTSSRIWKKGDAITGAVWNDYAEYRTSNCTEPGYVVMEKGDDTLVKTTERLQHFAGVTSDTWGFAQGETEEAKTPIAVAGRVLVYTYKDRNSYKPGDVVCAAPNGTVDIMTREEVINFPDRIVGIVSCVPDYEEWGGGRGADRDPVKINNRIWIKVK